MVAYCECVTEVFAVRAIANHYDLVGGPMVTFCQKMKFLENLICMVFPLKYHFINFIIMK